MNIRLIPHCKDIEKYLKISEFSPQIDRFLGSFTNNSKLRERNKNTIKGIATSDKTYTLDKLRIPDDKIVEMQNLFSILSYKTSFNVLSNVSVIVVQSRS
jgi:hypothetical protein